MADLMSNLVAEFALLSTCPKAVFGSAGVCLADRGRRFNRLKLRKSSDQKGSFQQCCRRKCRLAAIIHISGVYIYVCRKIYIVRHWKYREKLITHPSHLCLFFWAWPIFSCYCTLFCAVLNFCASGRVFILLLRKVALKRVLCGRLCTILSQ